MARTVKEAEYAGKRNQILDAAQQLVYRKGYERMTIQDILAELHISSGAFFHYFANKPAVLEALVERMQAEMEASVLPIADDESAPATKKLRRFFDAMLRKEVSEQALGLVMSLLRMWFADDNALLRQKADAARIQRLAPLLTEIIQQGVREGSFSPADPDWAAEVALALVQGLEYSLARVHAQFERDGDESRFVRDCVNVYAEYMDAVERSLGAPAGLLSRLDPTAVRKSMAVYNSDHAMRS